MRWPVDQQVELPCDGNSSESALINRSRVAIRSPHRILLGGGGSAGVVDSDGRAALELVGYLHPVVSE